MEEAPEKQDNNNTSCRWNDTELTNIKSVKESLDHIHAYTGLMAGFEGFIINEYVNQSGAPPDDDGQDSISTIFQIGLGLLIFSFVLNVATAMSSFLWGVFIREGTYQPWFMTVVGRMCKLMATGATFTFIFGVLCFIDTIGLEPGLVYTIYAVSIVLFVFFLFLFLFTLVRIVPKVEEGTWKTVMEHVN